MAGLVPANEHTGPLSTSLASASATGDITINTRTTRISIGLLALVLVFGAIAASTIAVPQLEAKPISTKVSMNKRLKLQEENCTTGGGKYEVTSTTTSNNGPLVTTTSVTNKCTGGALDGLTCINTLKTMDCSTPLLRPTLPPLFAGLPDAADPNAADPPVVTPINSDVSDPGPPQVLDPGLPEPTPTPAPRRPTFEPVSDPLD